MLCCLNITFCNSKDKHFNKRIAREVLNSRQTEVVRVRDLPRLLCEAAHTCKDNYYGIVEDDFNFILKRFV